MKQNTPMHAQMPKHSGGVYRLRRRSGRIVFINEISGFFRYLFLLPSSRIS
jgi:hypothetical protein